MTAVDPRDLKPGDWFVWHELNPTRYRVLRSVDESGRLLAEDERNIALHGDGGFTPAAVYIADRRFELVPPPVAPLPTEQGAYILATVIRLGGPALLFLGHRGDSPTWFQGDEAVAVHEIQPGWVRIDPATLRPVEAESAPAAPAVTPPSLESLGSAWAARS